MPEQPSLFPDLDRFRPHPRRRRAPRRRGRARGALRAAARGRGRRCRRTCASGRVRGASRAGRGWSTRRSGRPGWLAKEGLREYARHPLFGTVGVDRSYYAPVPDEDFRRYADQLPDGFPCCCKAPGARSRRPVRTASADRPRARIREFLSADRFVADLLEPVARSFRGHAGPFILQFPPMLRRSGIAPAVVLRRPRPLPRRPAARLPVRRRSARPRAALATTTSACSSAHGAAPRLQRVDGDAAARRPGRSRAGRRRCRS